MAAGNYGEIGEWGLLVAEVGRGECSRRGDLRIGVTSSSNTCQLARLAASERETEGANAGRGSPGEELLKTVFEVSGWVECNRPGQG